MAQLSPYRSLPVERRIALVTHEITSHREARATFIQRMVSRGGGFRPETLRKWTADQLAREIVRRNMESAVEEIGLLQTLYVELEPAIQIAFLEATGVEHVNGQIPEELEPPFADEATVKRAAEQLVAQFGDDARHYLRTIAIYNQAAWPGLEA